MNTQLENSKNETLQGTHNLVSLTNKLQENYKGGYNDLKDLKDIGSK